MKSVVVLIRVEEQWCSVLPALTVTWRLCGSDLSLYSAVRHILHKRYAAEFLMFLIKPKTYSTLVACYESLVVWHGTMSLLFSAAVFVWARQQVSSKAGDILAVNYAFAPLRIPTHHGWFMYPASLWSDGCSRLQKINAMRTQTHG